MGSALLDAANKRHWELIQQTEGGTAWLLQHYEAYASALAQNMRHTYLSPFTIVTPFHPSLFAHACCSLGQRELPQAPPLELSTRQLSLTHWNSVCKWKGFSSLLTLLWFAQCFRHQ